MRAGASYPLLSPTMAPITRWRIPDDAVARILRRKRVQRALLADSGLYSLIERVARPGRRIEVTRHRIAAPVREPVRIAHVTDLHVLRHGEREERVNAILEQERPDAILLGGDNTVLGGDPAACATVLGRMHAPLGVWGTLGNWDYWHGVPDWESFLAGLGIELLRNRGVDLVPGVRLIGLDSAVAGEPDFERAVAGTSAAAFTLALIHCPVLFDEIAGRVTLAVAGHTHGGQIRVPGLPPLMMPAGCRPYADGWYDSRGSRMYVNRGIGSPGYPMRIACPAEIAIFTLEPAADSS